MKARRDNNMNYRKISSIVAVVLCITFCIFVLLHERYARKEAHSRIKEHAVIIKDALWNFNSEGVSEYISLACKSQNYERLVVTDTEGKIFQKAVNKKPEVYEGIFMSLNLIPSVLLVSDVFHDGETIGRIEAIWNCDTIYLQIYVLFALIMFYAISHLYLRLLHSKHVLEEKVRERTLELTNSNISLQNEVEEHGRRERHYERVRENIVQYLRIYRMSITKQV